MNQKITLAIIAILLAAVAYTAAQLHTALGMLNTLSAKISTVEQNLSDKITSIDTVVSRLETKLGETARELTKLEKEISLLREMALAPSGEVQIRYARFFNMRQEGGYYLLRDAMGRTILLTPRGATAREFYVQKYKPDVVVEYPVRRVVYMSSTHVGLLYRLYVESGDANLLKTAVGIMWGRVYDWHLPEVKDMLNNGTITDVGPPESPNFEKILALKPDVVFVYFYPGPYGTESTIEKLKQLKIPYVVINEFQETTALGRFEWIKFVAAFYNKTELAVEIFNRVEAKWNSLTTLTADLERPRVAWFIVFGGVLYPAGATARELIRLAGGRYAYANYSRVDMEVVVKHRNDVDVLIWSGYGVQSLEELVKIDKRLAELKPVIAGRTYAYSPAFYQLSHVYPERLLEELVWIMHPEVQPPGEFKLFVQLK